MKVYNDIDQLPAIKKPVVTIGTFDGVHEGHQKILQRIKQLAKDIVGTSVLITFHPHPRLILNPDDTSLRLITTLDEKIQLLEKSGLDALVVTPFSRKFAESPAIQYVKDFLVAKFQPEVLVIGYDHRFGKNRSGDIQLLNEYKAVFGYQLEEISKHTIDDIGISSTKIRNALSAGEVREANLLLGHPFSIRGYVVRGDGRGKQLGFPTANLQIADKHKLIPANGVYAVQGLIHGKRQNGMLNIGLRPTFKGEEKTIEVHFFGLDQNLYGEQIQIDFIDRIRDEKKFGNAEELMEQLKLDQQSAEIVFRSN